jgi:hypothetical protein
MADIRIKDLTTTASTTAADDFFAADGATNGTRKLSAYSPTFGGNATVTGTLTVNGGGVFTRANTGALAIKSGDAGSYTDISLGRTAAEHFLAIAGSANNYVAGTVAGDCALNASSATAAIFVGVYGNAIGKFTSSGLSIPTTTASTTTSTGALVVGNGTSGGLGVGGAANIGGALTTNGNVIINSNVGFIGKSGTGTGGNWRFVSDDGISRWQTGVLGGAGETSYSIYDSVNTRSLLTATAAGVVQINQTTASTSTSSGALVVGNGTSGGLGVGGAIYAGGILKTTVADAAYNARFFGATGGMRVRGYTDATYGTVVDSLNTAESAYQPLTIASSTLRLNDLTNGAIVTGTGTFTISGTTASTSTSTGALVVSGGVGVAGAIYAGGNITIDKAAPDFTLTRSVNTNSGLIQLTTSTTYDFAIGLRNTTDSDLHIYNYGTSNDALKIARSDSLATFGGAVRTAAPSGGTAANWKLGTVATVSPTSPNRTIEVDIGGTIYYIHAKTTNN